MLRSLVGSEMCIRDRGVDLEAFMNAIKSPAPPQDGEEESVEEVLANMLVDYIVCLDDFPTFRAIMEKRNAEMDLEAMHQHARYAHQPPVGEGEDLSEEELFLIEMAIQMSMGESDIALKELEVNDRQMLQELTVKLAQEQERLMREQLDDEKREEAGRTLTEEFNSTVLAKREECLQKGLQEIAHAEAQPKMEAPLHSTPVKRMPKANELSPKKLVQNALAPVADRRQGGVFGQKAALPSIQPKATPQGPVVPQPSFEELKAAVVQKSAPQGPAAVEPSKDDMEKRAEYFKKQRELLRQQKAQDRTAELEKFKRDNGMVEAPQASASSTAAADEEKKMRIDLARRFKEDLLMESRKQ
eukprot:TRINITY_DN37231_c0_g1_i1.p1 TRINITY_DN37231_c0_g1~~TRINITY_DN37231_c0_g1_i1.p1  ORF type:complete len:358 (-),score=160.43 TRINITY_DN37231_c0_g1_i1:19-1092(-)